MVGYEHTDRITSTQKLVAGCVSGCMTRFITQPLDILKLRTQLQKQKSKKPVNIYRTAKRIVKEEGVVAFWHGHNLGQIHSILSVSSQFYVFELLTKYLSGHYLKYDEKYKPMVLFVSGVTAGCVSTTLVLPLEVIRVRQMIVKEQYGGLLRGAKRVYNNGGILAFYEGLSASLLQTGPAVGINFTMFSILQPLILNYLQNKCSTDCKHAPNNAHKAEHLLLASSVAGSIAGFISKTMTYPLDLAKRRLQIRVTWKKEGFYGLFRGWPVTVYKAQMTSLVAFTTYEMACYVIREIHT